MSRRRSFWIAVPLAVAIALGGVAGCFSEKGETMGPTDPGECPALDAAELTGAVVVVIRDFAFLSDTVHVRPGTRVAWVNCAAEGEAAHTTTADDGEWDSPLMTRGDAFSYTFDEVGEFPYHCEPHPFMRGVVIVE